MEGGSKKNLVSWIVFILVFVLLTFLTYFGLKFLSLNYKMRACLGEFEEQYSLQSAIHEYDVSCKDIFSEGKNVKYCDSKKNQEFCYYAFTRFIEDVEIRKDLCSRIGNLGLRDYC
jgi:hypothetical protein